MGGVSNTELNPTYFHTNHNLLLGLWEILSKLNPKQHWSFKKEYFLVKLLGKELFETWRPNIWVTDSMVGSTEKLIKSKLLGKYHHIRRFMRK